ncbi:restriction endonuclease [Neptunicella marina]|nr:restriction endonuclease [Neptunicella marina]
MVPLNPSFYPDFHYVSKGFVKDLFGKKKEQENLNNLLDRVLTKYNELLNPYFLNYAYLLLGDSHEASTINSNNNEYSSAELFQQVLVRKGFVELRERPDLLYKLLSTTVFASTYSGFRREIKRHIKNDLDSSLRSWIDESGTDFRNNLCLFLYFIWESKSVGIGLSFNENASSNRDVSLLENGMITGFLSKCERIYKEILIDRLDFKLSNFDPENFVSIYSIDAMDGFSFEEFLVLLFQRLGYDVKETKKTGDQGADLFVEKFGKKIVIQAKNYSGTVGNSAVQQALSAKTFYNCDDAMVITNSYFSRSAKELASASSVRLIDRSKLMEYLDDYNQALVESLENNYSSTTS